jgi:plastocyanin
LVGKREPAAHLDGSPGSPSPRRAFTPATVSAKVGQKVRWEHQDAGVTHTVTALDRSFRSGDLEEGDEFSHVFPKAGTFAYRCGIHPDMQGTVKVSG